VNKKATARKKSVKRSSAARVKVSAETAPQPRAMLTSDRAVTPRPGVLPPLTPAQRKAQAACQLVMTEQGRTAIVLGESDGEVRYLPMAGEGIFVNYLDRKRFGEMYVHNQRNPVSPAGLASSNVGSAARTYVLHMTYAGGSDEALEELAKLVPITPQEKEKIMEAKKIRAEGLPRVSGTAGASLPKKGGTKKAGGATRQRTGAAATFRELIMKGGLTDDQIFEAVCKRHPEVTPDKRSYVAWYRNDLRRRGEKPPEPKGAKKGGAKAAA